MRNYIYKVIIFVIAIIIIFEFTLGKHIENFNNQINYFSTKDGSKQLISSIKKEIKKANEKENYLDEEERILLKDFIKKIRKELEIN